jgi:bifunctional non-homologous end joining protein LigD
MLRFIERAQPVLVDIPPSGERWVHEIKQEGFRTQLILDDGILRAFSRSGLDWSDRYGSFLSAVASLATKSAILDGEMIVTDANGRSDFHSLARSIKGAPDQLVFVAFDLMWLDGTDLRSTPLIERRRHLDDLVGSAGSDRIVFSRAFEGEGLDVFKAVEQLGLKGIVSKRADGMYRSGTRAGWQKAKFMMFSTFDVIGVEKNTGGAPVAILAEGDHYMGQAFIALTAQLRDAFWRFVETHAGDRPPVKGMGRKKGAT